MGLLDGRLALITGTRAGIGEAIARTVAEAGVRALTKELAIELSRLGVTLPVDGGFLEY